MDIQKRNNDKEIYAPLKSKWLVMKPEEEVRQKYICRLVDSYGYLLKLFVFLGNPLTIMVHRIISRLLQNL